MYLVMLWQPTPLQWHTGTKSVNQLTQQNNIAKRRHLPIRSLKHHTGMVCVLFTTISQTFDAAKFNSIQKEIPKSGKIKTNTNSKEDLEEINLLENS